MLTKMFMLVVESTLLENSIKGQNKTKMINRPDLTATKGFFTHLLDGVTVRSNKIDQQHWEELEFDGEQPMYLIDGLDGRRGPETPNPTADNDSFYKSDPQDGGESLVLERQVYGQSQHLMDLRGADPTPQTPRSQPTEQVAQIEDSGSDWTAVPETLDSLSPLEVHKLDDNS